MLDYKVALSLISLLSRNPISTVMCGKNCLDYLCAVYLNLIEMNLSLIRLKRYLCLSKRHWHKSLACSFILPPKRSIDIELKDILNM